MTRCGDGVRAGTPSSTRFVRAGVENKAPNILRLSYEEHLCHATLRNDTAQRIQAFLGLAPPSKHMRLPLRQSRDDLAMRVSNWD